MGGLQLEATRHVLRGVGVGEWRCIITLGFSFLDNVMYQRRGTAQPIAIDLLLSRDNPGLRGSILMNSRGLRWNTGELLRV